MAANIQLKGTTGPDGGPGQTAETEDGDELIGGPGGNGQPAECKGVFSFQLDDPPTNGGTGGRGIDGTGGEHGGAGGNAGNYELHVDVLYSGLIIDVTGGPGGNGG